MNIKGLISNIIPSNELRKVDSVGRSIKSDSTHDRDGNGQESFNQNSQHQEKMTDQQLADALDHLRNIPAAKEHKWTVHLETNDDGYRFAIVKDNLGAVIRRIPELELWTLPEVGSPRGQLLKRSA